MRKGEEIEKKQTVLETAEIIRERCKKSQESQKYILKDKDTFVKEELKEKHKKPTRNTNYNCTQCNRTCIEDTNRLGYTLGSILTLSLYHWISEMSSCAKCKHFYSKHVYEKAKRFVELDDLSKRILEELEKEAQGASGAKMNNEELLKKLTQKVEENLDLIAKLNFEIDQLEIIPVTYDSYLDYLNYLIELKNKEDPKNQSQINYLVELKNKYEAIKNKYSLLVNEKIRINNIKN